MDHIGQASTSAEIKGDEWLMTIERITIGELTVNTQTRVVEFREKKVSLTKSELAILRRLILISGACTRDDLYFALYGILPSHRYEAESRVNPIITSLRKKISAGCIVTKRQCGY